MPTKVPCKKDFTSCCFGLGLHDRACQLVLDKTSQQQIKGLSILAVVLDKHTTWY